MISSGLTLCPDDESPPPDIAFPNRAAASSSLPLQCRYIFGINTTLRENATAKHEMPLVIIIHVVASVVATKVMIKRRKPQTTKL
jgi:hypothetical protein